MNRQAAEPRTVEVREHWSTIEHIFIPPTWIQTSSSIFHVADSFFLFVCIYIPSHCLTVASILSICVSYINIFLDLLCCPYGLCFYVCLFFFFFLPLDNILSATGMYKNAFFFFLLSSLLFDINTNQNEIK